MMKKFKIQRNRAELSKNKKVTNFLDEIRV